MSSLMGKVADKASILKASGSTLATAVIKATYHNTKPPKEKHVRTLKVYSFEQDHRMKEMIHLLAKRLEIPDWIVVMKTLCVFHRLLKEANPRFIAELKNKYKMFNLRKFVDMSSTEAQNQSLFIRKYSQYIEEKVLLYSLLGCEPEKDPDVVKNWTPEQCLDRLPRLQSQLNALINNKSCRDFINNRIIIFAFSMLLKDSFKLYRALNDGILTLLEHYPELPEQQVAKTLEIYKLFTKETDGINSFFDLAKKFSRTELPTLQHAPTGLVETLENHLEDLKHGRTPQLQKGAIDRNMFKKTQQTMHGMNIDELSGESDSDEEGPAKSVTSKVESWDPFGPSATTTTTPNKNPAPTSSASWDPFSNSGNTNPAPTGNTTGFGFDPFAPSGNTGSTPNNTGFGTDPFAPSGNAAPTDPFAPSGNNNNWANFGGNNTSTPQNNNAPNTDFNPWG